jgi:hypothetical protein
MKIKDYNDAIEFFKTNDFRAADGAWSEFYQSEVLEPRIMDQASIADDLEPGPLKDEMLKDFDPSQETYEEYLQRKRLGERPFNMAEGGRMGFTLGGDAYKRTTLYKKRQEAKKLGLTYDHKTKEFKPLKATAKDTEQSVKMINDWTKEWINKNSKNYGVREIDKFKKDLAKAWKKQLKVFEKNPKFRFPKTGPGDTLISTTDGLPYVRGLEIDNVTTPLKKDPTLGYEKIFYNKKLQNPEFNKKITEYLDFVNVDKRYGSVRDEMAAAGKIATDPKGKGFFKKSSGSKKAYLEYAKFADDDVVYFFGDVLNSRKLWNNNPASLNIYSILEQNIDPKKVKAYRKKLSTSYSSWMNNLKEVSDLAGMDFNKVLDAQYAEAAKMKKLFNVESLPFEFQYAQDHLLGLAEAKTLGDPKIARQTLNNIVAATKDQNRFLGTKGFTNRRIKLIKDFKAAPKNARRPIIEKLNTLSEEFVPGRLKYNVRKDGSLKITNLQPEKTFKARSVAYKKLAKDFPENIKKKLIKLGCGMYAGGRVGFSVGSGKCINRAIAKLKSGNLTTAENKLMSGLGDDLTKIAGKGGVPKKFWTTVLKGEGYFALADFANNLTKGQSLDKSFSNAVHTASFGALNLGGNERDLMRYAEERGLNTKEIKDWMDYAKTYGKYAQAQEDIDYAQETLMSDEIVGPDDSMLQTSVLEQSPKRMQKLKDELGEQYEAKGEEIERGYKDMNEAIEGVVAKEWNKTAGTPLDRGLRKMVGMKGDEGLVWGGIGALTREGLEQAGFGEHDALKGFKPQTVLNYHPVYGYKEGIKSLIREGDSPMEDMLYFMRKYYPDDRLIEEALRTKPEDLQEVEKWVDTGFGRKKRKVKVDMGTYDD